MPWKPPTNWTRRQIIEAAQTRIMAIEMERDHYKAKYFKEVDAMKKYRDSLGNLGESIASTIGGV